MAGMFDDVISALGLAPIFFWLNKITALFIIWWVGGKFVSKFESKLPKFASIIFRIIFGVVIYWAGIIIGSKYFPYIPFGFSDYIGVFVAFILLQIVISLLTYGLKGNVIDRKEFERLSSLVNRLDAVVSRLAEAGFKKKLLPELMDKDEAKELALKHAEDSGYKNLEVAECVEEDEKWIVTLGSKFRGFKLVMDPKTSQVLSFAHRFDTPIYALMSVGDFFLHNNLRIIGLLGLVFFVVYITGMMTVAAQDRINELSSLTVPETTSNISLADAIFGNLDNFTIAGFSGEDIQNMLSGLQSGDLLGALGNTGDFRNLLEGSGDLPFDTSNLTDAELQELMDAISQSYGG